jgi:hypothetical protein
MHLNWLAVDRSICGSACKMSNTVSLGSRVPAVLRNYFRCLQSEDAKVSNEETKKP